MNTETRTEESVSYFEILSFLLPYLGTPIFDDGTRDLGISADSLAIGRTNS